MSEEKVLCDKCGVNPANEMHECPYGAEINDEMIKQLESYQKAGKLGNEVWVTPELPFIAFITVGFLVALLVGNLVFALAIRS